MSLPKDVYEKFCAGDSLTDAEVSFGITFYTYLADNLFKCGPVFQLAAAEARRVQLQLEGFMEARQMNRLFAPAPRVRPTQTFRSRRFLAGYY